MNPQPDEFDILLDEALANYAKAEPRPGLEQRVLRQVHAGARKPLASWWPWALAIPVVAYLVMLAIPRKTQPDSPAPLPPAPPVIAHVAPPVPVPIPVPLRGPVVRTRPAHPAAFPTPAPLSAEERALLMLAQRYPEQAQALAPELKPHDIEPIAIPEIQIPPINGGTPQ